MTEREKLLAEVNRLEALRETARSHQDWDSAQGICVNLANVYRRLELIELQEVAERNN